MQSNAFFPVHSNWHYSAGQRQKIYQNWIEQLAEKAPSIFMYSSDCNNVSANCPTAGQYVEWLSDAPAKKLDELNPGRLNQYEIRY